MLGRPGASAPENQMSPPLTFLALTDERSGNTPTSRSKEVPLTSSPPPLTPYIPSFSATERAMSGKRAWVLLKLPANLP
jgi:hypothetical protein